MTVVTPLDCIDAPDERVVTGVGDSVVVCLFVVVLCGIVMDDEEPIPSVICCSYLRITPIALLLVLL